ncbi:hypothetical protein DXG01_001107 [Tephrocybe rancida]|nr:hypothetical protein DXG01_001107 [Tephrocybe rancida]
MELVTPNPLSATVSAKIKLSTPSSGSKKNNLGYKDVRVNPDPLLRMRSDCFGNADCFQRHTKGPDAHVLDPDVGSEGLYWKAIPAMYTPSRHMANFLDNALAVPTL